MYFELIQKKEMLEDHVLEYTKRIDMLRAMMDDIDSKIEVKAVSSDIESLRKDIDVYRKDYEEVFEKLCARECR